LQKVAFCCIFAEEKPALGNLKAAFIALVCIFFAEEKPALGNLKVELSLRSFAFSLQKKNLHSCSREVVY